MNLNTDHYDRRKLAPKGQRANTAKPPRTRGENPMSGELRLDTSKAHNAYPGGKILRKRLAKLAMRRKRYGESISRGHERGNSFYEPGSPSRQHPGSMQG